MTAEMDRREFLGFAGTGMAALGLWPALLGAAPSEDQAVKPNIIFILTDDLGYGDLGCYGQTQIATPNLDALASEGVRFTQCYSGSTVCAPSRCCLMTGMHGGHARVRDNLPHEIFLQPDDFTIAKMLKSAGYRTGAIGKWSLGEPGSWGIANWQGFDYFYGHLSQDQAHFYYPDYLWENDKIVHLNGNRGRKEVQYTHDLFTEKALDFVRDSNHQPFFLYLAYTIPHWSDYERKSEQSLLVPSDEPYTDRDWPQIEKNYAAMVTRMDRDVGRLGELLKELGLDQNTLIMFTSDNGPSAEALHSVDFFDSNGPLRGSKRDLFEGGIRVPMIARWPGHVPAGATCDDVWASWDVMPTLAEIAGLPAPADIDGISFAPAMLGRDQSRQHEYLYWDYGHVRGNFGQAIRMENWKGIRWNFADTLEIYDLENDLGETTNVAAQHPDIIAKIVAAMENAYVPSPDYPIKAPTPPA